MDQAKRTTQMCSSAGTIHLTLGGSSEFLTEHTFALPPVWEQQLLYNLSLLGNICP
jgi:hypothetical protein